MLVQKDRRRDPCRRLAPPGKHLEPGVQFRESERLAKVIVRSGLQAADSVVDLTQRAEYQYRCMDAGVTQLLHQ